MRHTLIILLTLLAPAVCHASAADVDVNPAQRAFDAAYSADMQVVKTGHDPRVAVELAIRMLAKAREAKSQPAFQAILCETAYELTLPYPASQKIAIEAMTLLAACVPEKALQCADCVTEVRQRQFDAARGEERPKAGEALLDAILAVADSHGRAGAVAEAAAAYKRAQPIATAIKSDRKPAIEAKAKELAQAAKNAADAAMLMKQLEAAPADAAVREKLVRLYLVGFDDPATAAKYLDGVADAALCKYVPAAGKGVSVTPEVACMELGNWYVSLAETAPAASKAALLTRAMAYYARFLELHLAIDADRVNVIAAAKKVDADLQKLSGLPGGKAADAKKGIDLLALVDLAKDAVKGDWQRKATGLQIAAGGEPMLLVLPVQPRGSYELEARFVRTAGVGTVIAILPVGSQAVALCMSWNYGQISALELINGKGPAENGTAVRPGTLQNNHEYALLIKVVVAGTSAQVAVSLDGRPLTSWQGPVSALSLYPDLRLPQAGCPGIGACDTTVIFRSARLRMLSGEAKPLRP